MSKPGEEFQKRAGHRFNLIIRNMPKAPEEAVLPDVLLPKLKRLGYSDDLSQLGIDLGALKRRGEISTSKVDGNDAYYVLPKGLFEMRKRTALIRLHNMDISEADLDLLEQISRRGKPLE